jgi:N-formylglutamate deformylase
MPSNYLPWYVERGHGPVVATAIHDGKAIRPELEALLALSESDRRREEDPYTGVWTSVAPTRIIGLQSRFEVDFNRPRDKAVYLTPEDAWGLTIWKASPSDDCVGRSLAVYDAFYDEVRGLLRRLVQRYGRIVVLDLHSYNHRRDGAEGTVAEPRDNPEINIGTGTMDRSRWAPLVDRFIVELRNFDFLGRRLDVRENVRFRGGHFPAWIHTEFAESVCVLSVEVKKFFMNEWTGIPDRLQLRMITRAFKSTVWGIHEELVKLGLSERRPEVVA